MDEGVYTLVPCGVLNADLCPIPSLEYGLDASVISSSTLLKLDDDVLWLHAEAELILEPTCEDRPLTGADNILELAPEKEPLDLDSVFCDCTDVGLLPFTGVPLGDGQQGRLSGV